MNIRSTLAMQLGDALITISEQGVAISERDHVIADLTKKNAALEAEKAAAAKGEAPAGPAKDVAVTPGYESDQEGVAP